MSAPLKLESRDFDDVLPTMFIRPQNPDDHRQFEVLLPQLTPLFVYIDDDDREWVRWSMPKEVAQQFGWGDMKCICCGDSDTQGDEGTFHIDTALNEVDWYLNRLIHPELRQ